MTVSIIIAVKTWQKNLEECVGKCLELDYPSFEILILPDNPISKDLNLMINVPIKVIPTGAINPAFKRDMALSFAEGEIIAFIDDDAYPERDWLKNAVENFKDQDIAAVGGPAITPLEDNPRQRASGTIYSSILVSGSYRYRYIPVKRMKIWDYPSCNFLVRKSALQELGGFKTSFWPGEDTKLCLDITKRLGRGIVYDPRVIVYHHRRPLYLAHLRQVANYALHRGYFVKRYPETSLKLSFFLPTLFVSGVILGLFLAAVFPFFRLVYASGLSLYLVTVFISSITKGLRLFPLVFFGIILTHFTYGIYFIKGLFSRELKEETV